MDSSFILLLALICPNENLVQGMDVPLPKVLTMQQCEQYAHNEEILNHTITLVPSLPEDTTCHYALICANVKWVDTP